MLREFWAKPDSIMSAAVFLLYLQVFCMYVYVWLCVYHLSPRFSWNANIQWPHQFRILGMLFLHNPKVIICHSEWIPHTSLSLSLDYTEHKKDKGIIKENGFFLLPFCATVSQVSQCLFSAWLCVRLVRRAARVCKKPSLQEAVFLTSLLCLPLLVFISSVR